MTEFLSYSWWLAQQIFLAVGTLATAGAILYLLAWVVLIVVALARR